MLSFVLQLVLLSLLAFGLRFIYVIAAQESFLAALCSQLGFGSFTRKRDSGFFGQWSYSFSGKYHGRQYLIEYRYKPAELFWHFTTELRRTDELEFRVPLVQKFWLRLNSDIPSVEGPRVELFSPAIRHRYLLHTDQDDAATEFLENPDTREMLSLIEIPFQRFEINRGWLSLFLSSPRRLQLQPAMFEILVRVLIDLSRLYEECTPLRIRISRAEEFCPYCRGDFDRNAEQVVECARCKTVLHQLCWNENGECTTWGCRSRSHL